MRKRRKTVYKVLTKEELSTFFACVDNYKFKTIFMLACGSGLRIGEITNLIENGENLLQVKELMGHSNIRNTMEYIHVANIDLELESPLDVLLRGEEKGKDSENIK